MSLKTTKYTREKEIALEAVTRAAKLCTAVQSDMVNADSLEKRDKSPVTVADFGAQAVVCQQIKAAFPQDPIVGEEDSADLQQPDNNYLLNRVTHYVQQFHPDANAQTVCDWIDSGNSRVADRFWTLDPIDGTKGFLRNEQYAIALALIEHGEVKVAALACPSLPVNSADLETSVGTIFLAVRGEGAGLAAINSHDFSTIQVVQAAASEQWRFVESVEAAHGDQPLQQAIAQAVGITHPSLRMDSQAKYGAVARGDAVLYLRLPSPKSPDYREKIWDHAAGSLIIEEAGGRVTDMHGRPLDFASDYKMHNNRGVVASNGTIHADVLNALRTS